jgi:hypothetical protein
MIVGAGDEISDLLIKLSRFSIIAGRFWRIRNPAKGKTRSKYNNVERA